MPFARFLSFSYFQGHIQRLFMAPLNILIVDDHPIMLEGVKTLLAEDERLQVLATATKASEALVFRANPK